MTVERSRDANNPLIDSKPDKLWNDIFEALPVEATLLNLLDLLLDDEVGVDDIRS